MPNLNFARAIRVSLPALGLLAAGCSADVARFDFPSGASLSANQTNSIPIPPATVHDPAPRAGLLGGSEGSSHPAPSSDVRVAELPPAEGYNRGYNAGPPAGYDAGRSGGYDVAPVRGYDAAPQRSYDYDRPSRSSRAPAARAERVAYGDSGRDIEVKPGDTLYGLSRQHDVPVTEIKSANGMTGDNLKPGQRLRMPAGRNGTPGPAKSETAAVQPAASNPEPAAAAAPADAAGTYTMKAGDSLYAIARKHNVKYAELQSHNGITDVRKLQPGTVLKIPGQSAPSAAPATAVAVVTPSAEPVTAAPVASEPPANPKPVQTDTVAAASPGNAPKVLNAAPEAPAATAPVKMAAVETTTDASPAQPMAQAVAASNDKPSSGRLRWPVQGKVISNFGPRPDGTHNDGINFSVPLGTDVHAAEAGEVIYVGDELKAYGKLVLVRHDNGWVTAYAHNDELKVTRGQKVQRGDVVAKAGKTGPVDQPQVHFELRQESKAVDPTSFMEKL
jgi:murein DD-endopeptidase MepM/ murein hydrolase activator NlpD